jgi:hypothetical protein
MRKYFDRYTFIGAVIAFLIWLAAVPSSTVAGILQAIVPAAVPTANKTGNSSLFQLGSGTPTSGHCASFDASGNIIDSGVNGCTGSGGSGTLFSNITSGTNTSGSTMTVGNTSTLNFTGTGVVNANQANGTTVTVNSAADQVLLTTASATGSWASVSNCTDTSGNHLNYATAGHAFSCGTSAGAVSTVNGTTFATSSAADQAFRTTASGVGSYTAVPNCTTGLTYDTSVHTFGCAGAAASSGITMVETHTASSSTSLNYTSCISSTYDTYQIEIVNLIPGTNNVNLLMRMSTDGGATYDSGANYGWDRQFFGNGSSGGGNTNSGDSSIQVQAALVTTANWSMNGTIKLYNPGGSIFKMMSGYFVTRENANGVISGWAMFGIYNVTTAVNAFQFLTSSGNIASGTIRCYGLSKT